MQTKTYFASNVPAALEVARRELGEDAMLVTSKPASASARPFGRLEVTFAYEAAARSATQGSAIQTSATQAFATQTSATQASAPHARPARSANSPAISEMDEIRQQISALKKAVARPAVRINAPCSPVAETLAQSGLSQDLADEIAAAVESAAPVGSSDAPDALARELTNRLKTAPFSDPKAADSRTVALVGPPGRGKTTTAIKIAVRFGLANRVPVKIYLAGSHGVGCEDQMARYAAILGVPFQACESLESLSLALNGDSWKGLALIDTPGISPSDSGEIGDFARFFNRRPEIEKHLVLRADARSADLSHVVARFSPMRICRLLFTGLDEALGLGSVSETLMRSGIPASLAGTGQRIPEDLETVSVSRLVRALQGENASAAVAA